MIGRDAKVKKLGLGEIPESSEGEESVLSVGSDPNKFHERDRGSLGSSKFWKGNAGPGMALEASELVEGVEPCSGAGSTVSGEI